MTVTYTDGWHDVWEEYPPKDPEYVRVSVDIDVMLTDGSVVRGCVYVGDEDEYYALSPRKRKIPYRRLKFWRIMTGRGISEGNNEQC